MITDIKKHDKAMEWCYEKIKDLKVMVDAQQKNIVRLQNMMEDDSFDEDDEFEPRQIISFNMIDTKPKLEPVDLKQLGFEVYLLMRGKK